MSIRVHGTIVINRKSGRKGDFNIGDLATEVGEFEVKDSLIEEFEPGKYTGEFLIKWIEPDSFSWRGRVFVKNRAQLEAIFIDDVDEHAAPPASPPEPDPIDAVASTAPTSTQVAAGVTNASQPITPHQPAQPSSNAVAPELGRSDSIKPKRPAPIADQAHSVPPSHDDLNLFGDELHEQLQSRRAIKLDPTVDRQQFRAQRDRLKALGYGFDALSQTWTVREEEPAF